jgi:cell division septation protein DedD
MLHNKRFALTTLFLVFILCLSLANVNSALADDSTPTEPPSAAEAAAETPVPATEAPVESTPVPVEATSTPEPAQAAAGEAASTAEEVPVTELLSQVPDDTNLVVLDENGEALSLASQDAAEIIAEADPMWCPEGVLPNGPGCTGNLTIAALLALMQANAGGTFSQNGVIYFERSSITTYTTAFVLDDSASSLGVSFDTLKAYNITLVGGWNGGSTTNLNGQTTFSGSSAYIQVGTSSNPWVGNVSLTNFQIGVSGANGGVSTNNSLTVYTTDGDISLSNVDVRQQEGNNYTAYLQSTNGDINIGANVNGDPSLFDGNNASGKQNSGFSATTTSGSILISDDTTFRDAFQTGSSNSANGATLSAPIVTLTNVLALDNDGNGIAISNANIVTLNNVTGGGITATHGNGLSGAYVSGNGSTILNVIGGTFNFNGRYGIEFFNSLLNEQSPPSCAGNGLATVAEPCYNNTSSIPTNTPTSTPTNTPTNTPTSTPTNTPTNAPTSTPTSTPTNVPNVAPTNTPVTAPTNTGVTGQSNGSSGNGSVIPVTGGELINLDCETTINAFGITVTFFNLCDYQTALNSVDTSNLPGQLPSGVSFVMGLEVLVLNQGQVIQSLPNGTGIQMDFPAQSQDQFAVLYWNGEDGDGAWIEISQQLSSDKLSQIMSADPVNELYHISTTAAGDDLYKVLTTEKTGTFVLVKK